MKQKIKWIGISLIIMMIFICVPSLIHAQPGPPCPDPAVPCPIDGGLSFLIAAGVGYGIKKVRDQRKADTKKNKLSANK